MSNASDRVQIGFKLMSYKNQHHMTQGDLAAYIGCSKEQVNRWCRCRHLPQKKWRDIMRERGIL